LTVDDHELSVCGQKLSVAVQKNQRVKSFLFLILKSQPTRPAAERAQNAGDGGGPMRHREAHWMNDW
jgi:hypothetical protein